MNMDPILQHTVGMLLVAAVILMVALAIDQFLEARKLRHKAWWKKKRDGQ